MKMKVSGELREQNNGGNAHSKYAIRGFELHLRSSVAVAAYGVIFIVLFLC